MRFDQINYPVPERWLDVQGVQICYVVMPARTRQDGSIPDRPVLLIPPLGRGLMHYRSNLEALSSLGPVIALDPPGCGKSQKSGGALNLIHLDGQTRVALAVIDECRRTGMVPERPALLVGTSYGALVSLSLSHIRPEIVRAAVLCNAAGGRGGFGSHVLRFVMSSAFFLKRTGRAAWRRGLQRMFADPNHPALGANLELAMKLRGGTDWPDYLRALSATTRAALSVRPDDLVASARARQLKTLVIWGDQDRVTSLEWGMQLASGLIAQLEVVSNAGHFPNIEATERFNELVLRFGGDLS